MTTTNVICFELKKPVVYNAGTAYEKTCSIFLACYGNNDTEQNKAYVNTLNTNEAEARKFCERQGLNYESIKYFHHHQQEAFDTRGD